MCAFQNSWQEEVKQSYAPDATSLGIQMGETPAQNQPPGHLHPHLTTTGKKFWGKQESDLNCINSGIPSTAVLWGASWGSHMRRIICEGIGMILATCRKSSPTVTPDCTMNYQHMKPCNPSKQLGTSFSAVERPVWNKRDSQDIGIPDLQKEGKFRGSKFVFQIKLPCLCPQNNI